MALWMMRDKNCWEQYSNKVDVFAFMKTDDDAAAIQVTAPQIPPG